MLQCIVQSWYLACDMQFFKVGSMLVYVLWRWPRLGQTLLWTTFVASIATPAIITYQNRYYGTCMVQSWYLACDMQFFMVGSVLVYVLWRWPRLGQTLLWITLVASIATPAIITYQNRYYGTVLHYMSLMKDPMSVQHYRDMYIPGHNRIGPYLVGIITASFYLQLKQQNFKFTPVTLAVGSVVAGTLLLGSCLTGWICYDRARPYSLWDNTLYAGIHRSVWALGMSWFIVAEGTTGFGTFYKVVKHRFFTPFGRLTYCVFLVHTIPQIYLTSSTRVPEYLTVPKLFWVVTGDAASAYILALYLNLFFEAPLDRLQKKTIKRLLKPGGEAKPQATELSQNGVNGGGRTQ
ncbi:hypothetical protein J6590_080610 [Homalodisca vitripennis]|nr:hypothetical protein J6590_080610 [Homalodisca vitripennis]